MTLQGLWRGAQAKNRVRLLLLEAYRLERRRLAAVRAERQVALELSAAISVQGAVRAFNARRLVQGKFAELDAEDAATEAAKVELREAQRARRLANCRTCAH